MTFKHPLENRRLKRAGEPFRLQRDLQLNFDGDGVSTMQLWVSRYVALVAMYGFLKPFKMISSLK